MATDSSPFLVFLEGRRGAIEAELARHLVEHVAFYRDAPPEMVAKGVTNVVTMFLVSIQQGRGAPIIEYIGSVLGERARSGLTLEQSLEVSLAFRKVLSKQALEALAAGVEGAREGFDFFQDVNDRITRNVAMFYRGLLDDAQRALQESETYHRTLYERMPVMLYSIDGEGRIVAMNDLCLQALGYTREEVLGRRSTDFLTEASARYAKEKVLPAFFRSGRCEGIAYQFVRKDGEVMDVLLSAISERDAEGNLIRSRAVIADVSEQMRISRALQESEARYRGLVDLAPDAVAVHRDGRILYINQAGVRMLGARDATQLIGREIAELYPPEQRADARERILRAEARGVVASSEETLTRLDGQSILIEMVGASVVYEGAQALQIVFRDVTERRRAEEAARRSAVQEELIRTQQDLLRALSTPLVPLGYGAILVPLVGSVDAARAEQMLTVLLEGVVAHAARVAILDVTGVPEVGAEVADALVRATRAVRLLGAKVILTGLGPAAARALIELGVELGDLTTRATLRDGILLAFRRGTP
ncbi:PAS domain S-box protein [Polyangium aurulentum]|uniref:PAS domain S-box protein n=1 Tax=Polyangium aurulentum TaxID=2567896 RepID=UPI00146CF9BE|nr:PAS domain S-box protein [Polyangium aurulentum]UQA62518.1 PAS domain S-box protein [Polyangium aurulentum]